MVVLKVAELAVDSALPEARRAPTALALFAAPPEADKPKPVAAVADPKGQVWADISVEKSKRLPIKIGFEIESGNFK